MPWPIFAALGTAAKVVGKSPIFKSAFTAAVTTAGNAAQGRATMVSSTGSTLRIQPDATVLGSNNNLLLLIGVGIVALFFIMKK